MELRYKKLHPDAKVPTYAHATDAAMDLYTVEDFLLAPGERKSVPTGLAFAIPTGYVGLIWDKSGVSHKRGIKCLGGVIDSGYRGEVFLGVVNVGTQTQQFAKGDKVSQMLIQKVEQPHLVEIDELDETDRGEGAFGSTGHN